VELPREHVLAGSEWADLAVALEDLKEKKENSMAGGRGKEESQVCFQGIIPSSSSSPLQMCHQPGLIDLGSGDLSLQLGSSASYSATSSSSNSRGSADQYDVDPVTDLSPDDLSFLQDGEVRAMFKKTTVNEALLNQAVDRLGGGRKGMKGLIAYIKLWIREKSNSELSMCQCIASLGELQTPALLQASSSSAVPDYNVSPHGHNTTPPVSLEPQVTNGLEANNSSGLNGLEANNSSGLNGLEANNSSGLKRPLAPFEPPLQHPPQAVHFHRDSKVCRTFGGTLFAEAAIDSGFSLRETVSCAAGGMTTYSPTICNSVMNLINPPNDRLMIHDMNVHQPVASLQTAGSGFERHADDSFNLSPAASKRAARKNRIAQQRQSLAVSRSVSQGSMSSLGCGSWTGLPGAGGISDRHQANSPIQPRAPVRNKGQVHPCYHECG
jgi:hypothetical protein